MAEDRKEALSDLWLRKLKDRPAVAAIVVLAVVVAGIGSFTDSIGKLAAVFRHEQKLDAVEQTFLTAEAAYRQRRAELISILYDRKESCRSEERRCPPPAISCPAERKVCPRRGSDKAAVEALKEMLIVDRDHFGRLNSRMERMVAAGKCKTRADNVDSGCSIPANDQTDLRGLDLEGVSLDYADLRNVRLQGSNLRRASFVLSHLEDSNLAECELSEADFFRASLRSANLNFSRLERANLRESDLRGATIMHASLLRATLESSSALQVMNWDGSTCPDGRLMAVDQKCF